jgi:DNA-directed RNA polymerase subunit L/DNA-directed RNA polymerase alpha subunit
MATIENIRAANKGFELFCELKNFPVSFVNGLRRVLIGNLPTVVIRDVQILENTTQLPHEMLKHRVEMLPVNVNPSDASTIKDAKIELRILPNKEKDEVRTITTDDFVVESGREGLLMKDRDLGEPIIFLRVRKGESVHIKARLSLENEQVSQVCTATTGWHIDPELAAAARKEFVEQGNDPRVFDNSIVQRYYSRSESGRPNWIDLSIESVGVLQANDLLKMAVSVMRKKIDEYVKEALENIQRESDPGTYNVTLEGYGHTEGTLMQEVIYSDSNVNFVSYDVPHPLKKTLVVRFNTSRSAESILKTAKELIHEYCLVVENNL